MTEHPATFNPNKRPISPEYATLDVLSKSGLIGSEIDTPEPGTPIRSKRSKHKDTDLDKLFPPIYVPSAPPMDKTPVRETTKRPPQVIAPPLMAGVRTVFLMQLSSFDSSHRTGVSGTSEILIPHEAIDFFPPLAMSGRKYPDVNFDIVLNTPAGRERHSYRLWYYEQRATGTRIDEFRLRMDHDTIDLSSSGGGDLIVINKLPSGTDPQYEVTILRQTDPIFPAFFALCTKQVYEKKWGIA